LKGADGNANNSSQANSEMDVTEFQDNESRMDFQLD
jgi:hypothetical protein